MTAPFTHLHLHTEYSMLDGLCRVEPLVERAHELGMDSIALTDHGALHAAVDFHSTAKTAGIKPIIGIEAYLARGDRHTKAASEKHPYHITLLAKNNTGYKNLLTLASLANLEGYYYKPRIDKNLLEQHGEGIIAFSGCLNGEIPQFLQEGRFEDAEKSARWFKEIMGDFYFEVQAHDNIPELAEVNSRLVDMSGRLGIPLVATNDVHYIHQEDHAIQDVLLCIQTNANIAQTDRMQMSSPDYYLRESAEMERLFSHLPEAITNTRVIADACDVSLDFSTMHLPRFPVPNGTTADAYLAQLCQQGLSRKIAHITDELQRRLDYELDVIRQTNFSDYFLVINQISSFAREKGILMGVRGSAAASLVLYCLDVTSVNPLQYGLVFERFLNIERKEMPDIDMDFQDDRRDEVMNYVVAEYGKEKVAQIITFGTLGAKAVLRDVGRAQGISYGDVDRVARMIPTGYRKADKGEIKPWSIGDALKLLPEFSDAYEADDVIKHLVDTGKQLEGVVRNSGTHAAGVVISDKPLMQILPLQRPAKGNEDGIAVTQFSMETIAKLGLLKMDFLGLVNLTVLQKTRQFLLQTTGEDIDLLQVPLDDERTFQLLSSGDTTGLFQLESTGMRRYIKELKPNSLADLSAMIALYRPGPLEQIPNFIDSKHGRRPVEYPHDILQEILQETYGIIVYQDQVLLILQRFAGYSLGRADIVRKAMGKKIAALMHEEESKFIDGAKAQGFTAELSQQVWNLIEPFAGYAFNKAHSVSYALIAYWTGYFKANHPVEFMASLLACSQGVTEKVAVAVPEARRLGISVLPPDINRSHVGFTIEDTGQGHAIRFGLGAIKNVGDMAVEPTIHERELNGPFKGVDDFCRRANLKGLNRRTLESLIKVGTLDILEQRGGLLENIDRILSISSQQARLRDSGQSTMFDLFGEEVPVPLPEIEIDPDDDVSSKERATWEKELLGVSISAEDPLILVSQTPGLDLTFSGQIDQDMEGHNVTIAGRVAASRLLQTRRDNRSFAIATLEDLQGRIEVAVWPAIYEKTSELWQQDNLVVIKGKVRLRNDEASVSCEEAFSVDEAMLESPSIEEEVLEPSTVENSSPNSSPTDGAPLDTTHSAKDLASNQPPWIEGEASPISTNGGNPLNDQLKSNGTGADPTADGKASTNGSMTAMIQPETNQAETSQPPEPSRLDHPKSTLCINLQETDDEEGDRSKLEKILSLIQRNPGDDTVRLTVLQNGDGPTVLDLKLGCNSDAPDLVRQLSGILGPKAVRVE